MIPFAKLSINNFQYRNEIIKSVEKVLSSSSHILGNETALFENEFLKYIGTKYAVGLGSGTDAIEIALRALGVNINDEIITVSHTASATISAILTTGAKPVLVDIEEEYYTIDPSKIEKAISSRTKAIIVVHLYGQSVNFEEVIKISNKYKIPIIEDVAQAHGASWKGKKLGSIGKIGCFSFYPTKNLGAIGDAGAITTDNKKLADKVKMIRQYGWKKNKRVSTIFGRNSRIDEIQSAILRVKLRYLDLENKKRNEIAFKYINRLNSKKIILPKIRNSNNHVFHLFVIRVKNRNKLINFLLKNNINTSIHYIKPNHQQFFYKKNTIIKKNLFITNKICKEILSLPIYPNLKNTEVSKIINKINIFYK